VRNDSRRSRPGGHPRSRAKTNPSRSLRPRGSGLPEDLPVLLLVLAIAAAATYKHLKADVAEHAKTALVPVVLGVSAAGAAALATAAALVLRRRPGAGTKAIRSRPSAIEPGWATRRELRPLQVSAPPGNRIVLGRHGRCLVAAEASQSVLLVGPTQSGKTSGVAIPAILEWAGPVVATSVKSDLVRATIEQRRTRGPVAVYDPTAVTGHESSGWSPLTTSTTWPGAKRMAAGLCSVARSGGGMEDAGFWYSSAEKLLAPLLLAAATSGASMSDLVRWIDDEELREPLLALELAGVPDALRAARTSFGREERQRASVFATAETVVAGFSDPSVAASTLWMPIQPAALLDGSLQTFYCCAPARDQERLRPVFVALLRQIIDCAFGQSARTGRPLEPPLLIVLDEAANIAPLEDLDTVLSTAASHGIQLLTVWQDMAQIEARYERRWPTIVNNHRAKVLCSGIADPLTLDHVSSLIGEGERAESSMTVGDDGHRTRTESTALRRVAPTALLRGLPAGSAVVVYGALAPAQVRLRPYYETCARL
jgi:type IV secretion system protein VirD4